MRESWSSRGMRAVAVAVVIATCASALVLLRRTAVEAQPTPARLLVSTDDRRAGASALHAAGFTSAEVLYVFLQIDDAELAAQNPAVWFYLDADPSDGAASPRQVERLAPYDFAGGSLEVARPFTTDGLSPGLHQIVARVLPRHGSEQLISATFSVDVAGADSLVLFDGPRRGAPAPLDGTALAAGYRLYAGLLPGAGATRRVEFFLDDPDALKPPLQIELAAPYDAFGGTASTPRPLPPLPPGTHALSARRTLTDGRVITTTAQFRTAVFPADTLTVSDRPNRVDPRVLDGAVLDPSGNWFITLQAPADQSTRVDFYLDDPTMNGRPQHTEHVAPYDLAGGSIDVASAIPDGMFAPGLHQITAKRTTASGGLVVTHASFEVGTGTHQGRRFDAQVDQAGGRIQLAPGLAVEVPAGLLPAGSTMRVDFSTPSPFSAPAVPRILQEPFRITIDGLAGPLAQPIVLEVSDPRLVDLDRSTSHTTFAAARRFDEDLQRWVELASLTDYQAGVQRVVIDHLSWFSRTQEWVDWTTDLAATGRDEFLEALGYIAAPPSCEATTFPIAIEQDAQIDNDVLGCASLTADGRTVRVRLANRTLRSIELAVPDGAAPAETPASLLSLIGSSGRGTYLLQPAQQLAVDVPLHRELGPSGFGLRNGELATLAPFATDVSARSVLLDITYFFVVNVLGEMLGLVAPKGAAAPAAELILELVNLLIDCAAADLAGQLEEMPDLARVRTMLEAVAGCVPEAAIKEVLGKILTLVAKAVPLPVSVDGIIGRLTVLGRIQDIAEGSGLLLSLVSGATGAERTTVAWPARYRTSTDDAVGSLRLASQSASIVAAQLPYEGDCVGQQDGTSWCRMSSTGRDPETGTQTHVLTRWASRAATSAPCAEVEVVVLQDDHGRYPSVQQLRRLDPCPLPPVEATFDPDGRTTVISWGQVPGAIKYVVEYRVPELNSPLQLVDETTSTALRCECSYPVNTWTLAFTVTAHLNDGTTAVLPESNRCFQSLNPYTGELRGSCG